MTVSSDTRSAMFDQETDDGLLELLTIDHNDLSTPIRVVNNMENVTSNSIEFIAFPFRIELPSNEPDRPPAGRLIIDNVSREIVESIRLIESAPDVSIKIVRLKDPNTVEVTFPKLILQNVRADALTVEGDLISRRLELEPYPAGTFTPGRFPGLF